MTARTTILIPFQTDQPSEKGRIAQAALESGWGTSRGARIGFRVAREI